MNYSKVVKVGKRLFRYDYDHALVEWVSEVDDKILADNKEWQEKYGEDLWKIIDGYCVNERVGLMRENWDKASTRKEYLNGWNDELDEECRILAQEYLMYG